MLFWITGGLGAARWESLPVTALVLAIGLVVAVAARRWMNVLHGGDDAAAAFGLKTPGRCGWCACSGSLLAGTAVAVVGGIVFAGLLVPHAATFLVAEARGCCRCRRCWARCSWCWRIWLRGWSSRRPNCRWGCSRHWWAGRCSWSCCGGSGGPQEVRVRGARVELGGRTILSDVDIEMREGEVFGLVGPGPNGSGKTTLRTLYRAVAPVAGLVEVAGQTSAGRRRRPRILAATTHEAENRAALTV